MAAHHAAVPVNEPIDLSRRRRQRDLDRKCAGPADIVVHAWTDDKGVHSVQMFVTDILQHPLATNRARAELLFDTMWQATSLNAEEWDHVVYAVYVDNQGHTWTRRDIEALEVNTGLSHANWQLRRAFDIVRPLLRGAFRIYLREIKSIPRRVALRFAPAGSDARSDS